MNLPMVSENQIPESFYVSKRRYEITINPNDKHQYFGNVRRLELFVMDIQKLLVQALDNYDVRYKLYIELSEPRSINKDSTSKSTSGARLHMHGYIICDDTLIVGLFLLKSQYYLSRWSDVQINSFREEYWPKYCLKQRTVMKALGRDHAIPMVLKDKMKQIKR